MVGVGGVRREERNWGREKVEEQEAGRVQSGWRVSRIRRVSAEKGRGRGVSK